MLQVPYRKDTAGCPCHELSLVIATFTYQVCAVVEVLCTISSLRGQQECTIPHRMATRGSRSPVLCVCVCVFPASFDSQTRVCLWLRTSCSGGELIHKNHWSAGECVQTHWGGTDEPSWLLSGEGLETAKGRCGKGGQYSSD